MKESNRGLNKPRDYLVKRCMGYSYVAAENPPIKEEEYTDVEDMHHQVL
jgi:hypothetical protein